MHYKWAVRAGLVESQAHFEDIYGLDPEVRRPPGKGNVSYIHEHMPQLLEMVSKPVKAVILLFPISDAYEQKRREEDERIAREGQAAIDPTIFWMKQTVRSLSSLYTLVCKPMRLNPDFQCMWNHGSPAFPGQCESLWFRRRVCCPSDLYCSRM